MDEPTASNVSPQKHRRNDLIRIYFCRKLLAEAVLSSAQLYPSANIDNGRHADIPLSEHVESPMEMNGTNTPNPELNPLQRLLNQHSDALTLRLEDSVMTPKTWNCGVYSPIEVYIDSPSGIDNSEQASTLLSSMSDDVSTASDLFEMDVLERINRLRRQGKWSLTRLPLCLDAPRPKTHMDYFLEECSMMHTDFVMERETKKLAAKMLAYEAKQYVQNKKNNVINLCRTSSKSISSRRGRQPRTIEGLISSLPSDYVGDLRSRLRSNDLFKEFLTSQNDKWEIVERVCNKISSIKPTNNLTSETIKLRLFAGTLRPYQLAALKLFINAYDNSFGCILSDGEKLGKKVEVIGFLSYLEEYRKVSGPHLIVTDEAAKWITAFERFLPNAKIVEFGEKTENLLDDFQVCLVDYETYFSDLFINTLGNSFFQVQIVDKAESLEFLHEKSLEYLFEENPLHGDYRFRILIGSCEFLEQTFENEKFVSTLLMLLQLLLPKSIQHLFESIPSEEKIRELSTKRLLSLLQCFQLARTESQVSDQVPSSSLEIVKCNMSDQQQRLYKRLLQLPQMKQELTSNSPIQAMDILRKMCSHPFLINDQFEVESPLIVTLEYPIVRQAFLDLEDAFCQQTSLYTHLERLQSPNLLIVRQRLESLIQCSHSNPSKLYINLYPVLARSIFQFVGQYDCSLLTIWQRNRSKQLANELFFKRSALEDEILSNGCLRLLDKNRLLFNSGKLQELFKILSNVRRHQQRCIIFTNYDSTQDLLCAVLAYHNFTYTILSDDVDRKDFLDTFNKNQRIACVLASTRNSLYRLNLNNIGAVIMLETDWKIEYNDNIKRFYTKCIQNSGAGFYNLVTSESLELRTNLFEIDVRPNLLDIGRSIENSSKASVDKDGEQKNTTLAEFTVPYAPICCDMDGRESVSDTLSTSGYEGSLDDNTSVHAEPLTYDRNFLESDSYLSSVFGLNWRYNLNSQDKYAFTEETQMFDSFSNPWYTGEVIEPDEIEYTKISPSEQQMDEDTLFEYGDEQEHHYIDSRALSPKSTDDFLDLSTPPASAEASRMSTEFSLDPAIQMQSQRSTTEHDQESRMALKKTAQRLQSRSDELRRKLLETQAIVLPDAEPLFRPDGKSGYMPPRFRTEWADADIPAWTYIEDHALLALTVKQLRAIPIPSYVSRNFCVNWNLIAFDMDKVSFQKRTPNQCCTRFRELISKKFSPVESPATVVEQFDELDLSLLNDERVSSSVQYSTRCFNRSIATLARKLEDLKRVRNIWQARTNWLNSCDDAEHFDILKRFATRDDQDSNNTSNSTRIRCLMDSLNDQPSEILTPNKKSLPLDMVMVYHQYSRGIRLSRVLTTAKSFMVKALKQYGEFGRIPAYNESISLNNRRIFIVDNGSWKVRVVSALSEFNYHSHKVPKIQQPIESRLLWIDSDSLSLLNRTLDTRIQHLLQSTFMQYTVDIRSNMMTSRKLTFEIVQIASKFIQPKMPKIPKNVKKMVFQFEVKTDNGVLDDIKNTVETGTGNDYRVLKNGTSLLPIMLNGQDTNYPPLLIIPSLPSKHHININTFSLFLANINNIDEGLKKELYSIAEMFEDFLLACQDYALTCIRDENQAEIPIVDSRLFAKNCHSNLILKIGRRATTSNNTEKASNSRYVIYCVPGDHFELHQRMILPIEDNRMEVEQLESDCRDRNSILTVSQRRQCINQSLNTSTVTSVNSARFQRHLIQMYVDENLHKSTGILNLIDNNNNFDYELKIQSSMVSLTRSSNQLQPKRRSPSSDLSSNIPSIKCLDSTEPSFLISSDASSSKPLEVYVDIDEKIAVSNKPIDAVLVCSNQLSRVKTAKNEVDNKPNLKVVEDVCQQMQVDENCISVQNLKIINQIYKLHQSSSNSIKFVEEKSDFNFKLPRPTIDELSRLRDVMKSRFVQEKVITVSYSIGPTNKELNDLINRHFSKFSTELKNHETVNKMNTNQTMFTIALKLKINNLTPHFSNILPINSSKFDVDYKRDGRVLRLRYQSAIQHERFNVTTNDGIKHIFDIECKRSEINKPLKTDTDHVSTTCLALEKSIIKATLINSLMKMPNLERQQLLDALKHQYFRIINLQHKQKALRTVDKMHRTIDQILKENNQLVDKNDELTEVDSKKTTIKRLLLDLNTKFPTSLDSQHNQLSIMSNVPAVSTNSSTSTNLANLLIQTAAKTQMNLSERIHPTFDLMENWKDNTDALKINYKDANKSLIVFDKSLKNFYDNVKLPSNFIEDKPIESSDDIYKCLLAHTTFGPSKIIKFRAPTEKQDPKQSSNDPQKQEVENSSSNDPNLEHSQTSQSDYESNQQNDPNRERSLPTIPSAMQVPASAVYHLKTDTHGNPMSQQMSQPNKGSQNMDQVYYTKRNPSFSGSSENTQNNQRQIQPPEHYQHSSSAPPSVHDNFRKDLQTTSKTGSNRQVVRQVVVGSRSKMVTDQQGNNFQNDRYREDTGPYDNRYYQPASGQRELTVREKLQRDLAMGVVQPTNQKKLYPVRMPTTVKRKLSESQQFGDESAPKRGRTQYVYQNKGSMSSGNSFSNQTGRSSQSNVNANLSNQSEQQTTSQTVPMIFHHGEPIKTYIRRENHQFAIHEPDNYTQQRFDTQQDQH